MLSLFRRQQPNGFVGVVDCGWFLVFRGRPREGVTARPVGLGSGGRRSVVAAVSGGCEVDDPAAWRGDVSGGVREEPDA